VDPAASTKTAYRSIEVSATATCSPGGPASDPVAS